MPSNKNNGSASKTASLTGTLMLAAIYGIENVITDPELKPIAISFATGVITFASIHTTRIVSTWYANRIRESDIEKLKNSLDSAIYQLQVKSASTDNPKVKEQIREKIEYIEQQQIELIVNSVDELTLEHTSKARKASAVPQQKQQHPTG